MNKLQRKQVFDYVYSKADQASYMAMESPASTAFQDGLESDADLFAIAGEQLTRKYIKDTILNRYSKDRRYIDASDVIAVITGLVADDVVGTKAEFGNGIFHVLHNGQDIRCTSVSFNQWETSIKRFGKWDKKEIRFVFLTCGGVSQSEESILNVKDILASLGMIAFIVKPNDPPRDISTFIKSLPPSNSALPHAKLDLAVFFSDLTSANLSIDKKLVDRFVASLCTKPLCILTGLSGSGKTKLAEAFAWWICNSESQYRVVAVGADWTSNENLLGYADALHDGVYVAPNSEVLDLLISANKDENSDKPFFLILDEMNLSHVERYFSDFLSAIEAANPQISLHSKNELKSSEMLIPGKIKLPGNLFIIGTVNVDETTYMFSPKVLDRSNVIEFRAGEEQMLSYLKAPSHIDLKALAMRGTMFASAFVQRANDVAIKLTDAEGVAVAPTLTDDLMEAFKALEEIGAEFGFRTAKEIARFIVIHKELSGPAWNYKDALDAQIIQKLMPKLHGSARKLDGVLDKLSAYASKHDLSLTAEKVARMQSRLKRDGFTSFAEN